MSPRFVCDFSGEFQVGRGQRFQKSEWVQVCLQVAPAAKRLENPFALRTIGRFLLRFSGLSGAIRFQSCTVCHGVNLPIPNFAIERLNPQTNHRCRSRSNQNMQLDLIRWNRTR